MRELIPSRSLVVHRSFSPFFEEGLFEVVCVSDGRSQCPPEGLALNGDVNAFEFRMHPGAPAWESSRGIHHNTSVSGDHPHKRGAGVTLSATQAGSDGFHGTPVGPIQSSITESGWMSIRAPVSLAAKRAFCPSLPIASESW